MADEHTSVRLGNPNPQMQMPDGSVEAEHLNQTVTRIDFVPDVLDPEKVELTLSTDNDRMLAAIAKGVPKQFRPYTLAIYEAEQIMAVHSAGHKPTWVASEDTKLAEALADYFDCAVGEPVAVLTNAGRDALHEQHLSTSQPATFQYGALSPSAATPEATDTTLAEEITTAGGGLLRAKMTFAHSAGTNTSTLTFTWTANGSDSVPVTVRRWANFNLAKQSEGGGKGMAENDKLNASATITVSGDSITVTFTLTAG